MQGLRLPESPDQLCLLLSSVQGKAELCSGPWGEMGVFFSGELGLSQAEGRDGAGFSLLQHLWASSPYHRSPCQVLVPALGHLLASTGCDGCRFGLPVAKPG